MSGSHLYCRIETPKGSFAAQRTRVERWVPCPADLCYFPDTRDDRGRPLEAMVYAAKLGVPGDRILVKPIALIRAHTRRGIGNVVMCVVADDPVWGTVDDARDLPAPLRNEVERFLIARRPEEHPPPTLWWCSRADALTAIDDAAARWASIVSGHG